MKARKSLRGLRSHSVLSWLQFFIVNSRLPFRSLRLYSISAFQRFPVENAVGNPLVVPGGRRVEVASKSWGEREESRT